MLTSEQQKKAAAAFAQRYLQKMDQLSERGNTQLFWSELLRDVLGVDQSIDDFIKFESKVKDISDHSHQKFVDAYIQFTRTLIEQKGPQVDLDKSYRQADGEMLTPFEQARRYNNLRKFSEIARYIVICNFREFRVYDMESPSSTPEVIYLKDLPRDYYRLRFLVDNDSSLAPNKLKLSLSAGQLLRELYNKLEQRYVLPYTVQQLNSLNVLCVRLVFCWYAEDAGLFGSMTAFQDFILKVSNRVGSQ